MDVGTNPVIPSPASPAAPQGTLPGTQIGIPIGTGVEGLTAVTAPFRTNAPPWYSPANTVWSAMGCAVPQAGRYIQTNSNVVFEVVNEIGKSLFEVMWKAPDRCFDRSPSRECLWQVYQMLLDARKRLANNSFAPNETPLLPSKFTTAPQMFLVYPVPFYGPLGCPNQWMHRLAEMVFAAMTEAMQHADNELAFHTTKDFFNTVWAPLGFILSDMAWRFFGIDRKTASDLSFAIPDAAWQSFDNTKTSPDNSATSTRPPMGYRPTNQDLEVIRGLPYAQVVGFLQPWPASNLLYSSGGVWKPTSTPNPGDGSGADSAGSLTNFSNVAGSADVRPSLIPTAGPPSA